jgi:hypothetical protein
MTMEKTKVVVDVNVEGTQIYLAAIELRRRRVSCRIGSDDGSTTPASQQRSDSEKVRTVRH